MVRVTENKLIIEIESDAPALLLRDLQESSLLYYSGTMKTVSQINWMM